MQAHALGEVGILGTVLLRVYSGTLPPILIEIGSYLTDNEQKISWHSFFETQCILNSSLLKHGSRMAKRDTVTVNKTNKTIMLL